MSRAIFLVYVSIVCFSSCISAAKIVAFSHESFSHAENFIAIGRQMTKRGHQFSLLISSTTAEKIHTSDIDIVVYPASITLQQQLQCIAPVIKNRWNISKSCMRSMYDSCNGIVSNMEQLDELKKDTDLLLVDITSICSIIVDGLLNVSQVIAYSPAGFIDPMLSRLFHIPAPPSYVPTVVVDYPNKMTFLQRTYNTITHIALVVLRFTFDSSVQAMYNKLVNSSSFKSFGQFSPTMLIVSTDFSIDYPRPVTPATKVVGALLPHAPLELPQELDDFARLQWNDNSDFIIVSFGTLVSKEMNHIIDFQAIKRALSRLPMKVIWKYHNQMDDLGDNIKIVSWLPQNDLLAHTNCKLFVTHCGLNSMYESVYHAVPMVAVPLFADQPSNAQRVKSAGIGEVVLFKELNEQSLYHAILKVYQDQNIAAKSLKMSRIMKDRPGNRTPVEEASDWIEFAMRHNGGRHLTVTASKLRWYELYMLDVAFVLITVVIVIYKVIVVVIGKAYAYIMKKCSR